jgi:Tol biopolymer transport system component
MGPAWSPDGAILFNSRVDVLASVPATGGPVTTVLTADPAKGQTSLGWPRFLPDGRHFIYVAQSLRPENRGIYVASLDSKEQTFLVPSDLRAWYAPPGYLIFPRDETLVAQAFDATRLQMRGEPQPIAEGVWFARGASQASFSVSSTGALAYVNSSLWNAELSWFDRQGRPLGPVGAPDRYSMTPQLSPDGRRLAIGRGEFGLEDNWTIDLASGTPSRLTFSPVGDGIPIWAADGRRVMYSTGPNVVIKNIETGEEETVLDTDRARAADWSKDGRSVVLVHVDSDSDLWAASLDGDRKPFALTDTPYNEAQPQLSPDGKWVAYTANETGRDEVYVQSFPIPGRKRQISTAGGVMPRWRRDGTELFYLAANQFITAVPIQKAGSLELGAPVPLFRTQLTVQGSESNSLPTSYDVAPDGQRFLLRYPPRDPGPSITVVLNWPAALKK